jgi:hypothetical protein
MRMGAGAWMLHITNGDSAGETLGASGVPGEVLPWRDILHEGPVPPGFSLGDLSEVRARFIVDAGFGGAYDDVLTGFRQRDAALARCAEHKEVALWFEHDLYDQLHLLQLLDWFAGQDRSATRLSLICIGAFAGHPIFYGLGQLSPAELASLFPSRHTVTDAEMALARAAWQAFRSPDPTALEEVLSGDTSALPFLRAALRRHLEDFPSTENGLSRTERELLEVILARAQTPHAIFGAWQAREDAPYMGDTPLWAHLHRLGDGPQPLVALTDGGVFRLPREAPNPAQFAAQHVTLTDAGRAVLAGRADHLALNGIDRWLGGVYLHADCPLWRWHAQYERLVRL